MEGPTVAKQRWSIDCVAAQQWQTLSD